MLLIYRCSKRFVDWFADVVRLEVVDVAMPRVWLYLMGNVLSKYPFYLILMHTEPNEHRRSFLFFQWPIVIRVISETLYDKLRILYDKFIVIQYASLS